MPAATSPTKQANALFKAIKKGQVAKVLEMLAAGVSIESTDLNKRTPVMLAAQAGQVEVFRLLVELGANLGAQALDQEDLLGNAAEGGNVEIIQFVLKQGHPIEGHWQPRSKAASRMGHMTPLISAAINGHADAVRLLLEAGANREATLDDETALEMVARMIKFPIGDDGLEAIPRLREVAALLDVEKDGKPESRTGRRKKSWTSFID